jgi:hypothetical protein
MHFSRNAKASIRIMDEVIDTANNHTTRTEKFSAAAAASIASVVFALLNCLA